MLGYLARAPGSRVENVFFVHLRATRQNNRRLNRLVQSQFYRKYRQMLGVVFEQRQGYISVATDANLHSAGCASTEGHGWCSERNKSTLTRGRSEPIPRRKIRAKYKRASWKNMPPARTPCIHQDPETHQLPTYRSQRS